MTTTTPQQPNIDASVTEKAVLWIDAVVRWTRDEAADIRLLPDNERGSVLTQVRRGDPVQVRTDLNHVDWVPCRYGHVTGWLNIRQVKLTQTSVSPTKEVVRLETKPRPSGQTPQRRGQNEKVSIIQRIVRFLTS